MSRVYKQKKSKNYYMEYRDEHGMLVRRTTGTADKSAARAILVREERAVELRRVGVPAASPMRARTPIDDVVDRYLDACDEMGNAPRWVDDKRWRLRKVVAWTGVRDLGELRAETIRGLLEDELAGMSRSTRNAYLSTLRSLCEWAIGERIIAANPAEGIKPGRRTKRAANLDDRDKRRCLWTPEIPMLLGAEPADPRSRLVWQRHRRPLYVVAMGTGLRRGTLERIEPRMIKLDVANPHINVPGELLKSGRRLIMPVRDPSVRAAIEQLLRTSSARGKRTRWHGQPFAPVPKSDTTFRADIKRAGIPRIDEDGRRVVFHSLRATFATQLALNGFPAQVTMELMDHQDIGTTLRYYTMVGVTESTMFMDRMPAVDRAFDAAVGAMCESMR